MSNTITVSDILFTTAHKAKGLEFSTVRITDDFTALFPTDAVLGTGLNVPNALHILHYFMKGKETIG